MEQLIKSIEEEKQRIESEMSKEDRKIAFYRDFFSNNECTTIGDLKDLNGCELALAILAQSEEIEDFQEIEETVHKNRVIFEELDAKSIENIKSIISRAKCNGYFNFLRTGLKMKKNFNPFSEEGRLINKVKLTLKSLRISPEDFSEFMDLSAEHSEYLNEALEIVSVQKELEKAIKRNKEYATASLQLVARQKNNDNMLYSEMKLASAVSVIVNSLGEAKKYYDKRQKVERHKQATLIQEKEACEKLERKLQDALTTGEIKNLDSIIDRERLNPNLRKQALEIIYNHNNGIYGKMTEEYEQLTSNDDSKYRVLLSEYGINPEDTEIKEIMKNSLEDLDVMLQQLARIQITSPKELLQIIRQSNLETINNYIGLIEREVVTVEIFKQHKELFNPQSEKYENFMRNLSFLQDNKINPRNINSNENVFITPHQILSENINALKEYDFLNSLKTADSSFLSQEGLAKSIDTLLELGYEQNLEENLGLLNHKDKFTRLQVLKVLNIPVSSSEELLQILTTDKFFIPDSTLEKYIYNAVDYNLLQVEESATPTSINPNELDKLTEFENTSRTYSIDGILISRNKVIRNLERISPIIPKNDRIVYSVIKDSLLSDEEYEKVVEKLATEKSSSTAK